jgi:serine protease AprX
MGPRLLFAFALLAAFALPASGESLHAGDLKLDGPLRARAHAASGRSRIILTLGPGLSPEAMVAAAGGTLGRRLPLAGGWVAEVPDAALDMLASDDAVRSIRVDRPIKGTLERTGAAIGSDWVRDTLGFDGSGVGIAIVDSGIAWHDDLTPDHVVRFVDFVSFQPTAYDDYGHGTHVAGIIAGSGLDSGGRRRGIAPGASLLVEKVLDADGDGFISNVIAAIDYAVANKDTLHIRVINLSVAAGVYESYNTDPLTLAAKRAVDAGIVVVSAAGNLGRSPAGSAEYGGVGAPGNAPWVLTVGASSDMGTAARADDAVAAFSSRGPSAIDFTAKPDVVAPGVDIESLTDPTTTLYRTKAGARLWGSIATATAPYLALSGTSMASPLVTGTIALMLQANPALTPNLVKAILHYTAEFKRPYNALTQGAGFLDARGAVELASSLAAGTPAARSRRGDPSPWSGHIIWGNHRVGSGVLDPDGTAWRTDVVWGTAQTPDGRAITWGDACADSTCDALARETDGNPSTWGVTTSAGAIVWGTARDHQNVVWGTECGGGDCREIAWRANLPRTAAPNALQERN